MKSRKNCSAINFCFALSLLLWGLHAHAAQVAGTVMDLNGPLLAKKANGTVRVLAQKSLVEEGDFLVTEKDTYARIRFLDNSEVTLKPETQFKIERFAYEQDKPQNDNAFFSLLKGGLRAVSGTVGKRSRERTGLNTPAATIGIRGTIYVVEYIAPGEADVAAWGRSLVAAASTGLHAYGPAGNGGATMTDATTGNVVPEILPARLALDTLLAQGVTSPVPGARPPGLYVQVLDGMINVSNKGGAQNFSAGQFGYTANLQQPPVVVPSNPGLKFTPPPAFSSSSVNPGGSGNGVVGITDVNCEVR
ncbi:FecR family protein [Janthinobacterium sp. 17J80-10]|uniref:FecR family protein n=1 Tax=Janthinobacterium sp. 17J80-10 TaxID=2497863 RepID=UPI001F5136E2|nr:FecR family protein [Janthinobacterium sp. 17J80-10]